MASALKNVARSTVMSPLDAGAGLPRSDVATGVAVAGFALAAYTFRTYLVTLVAWSTEAVKTTDFGGVNVVPTVTVIVEDVALAPSAS